MTSGQVRAEQEPDSSEKDVLEHDYFTLKEVRRLQRNSLMDGEGFLHEEGDNNARCSVQYFSVVLVGWR